jgi:hypothetical protein
VAVRVSLSSFLPSWCLDRSACCEVAAVGRQNAAIRPPFPVISRFRRLSGYFGSKKFPDVRPKLLS